MAGQPICYPTTVFFLFVTGTFLLCGILHPQEITCVLHGFTYYLAIPTMYMLLVIYSVCNMHVVSWGTREAKQTPTEKQQEQLAEQQRQLEEQQKKGTSSGSALMASLRGSSDPEGLVYICLILIYLLTRLLSRHPWIIHKI